MKRAALVILLLMSAPLLAADPPRPDAPRPRVVSFSPAITEMLFDMGLGDHVVGVTNHCTPPAGQERARIGDAFTVNASVILAAAPDVIFTQVAPVKFKGARDLNPQLQVIGLEIERLADVPAAMMRIGETVGRPDLSEARCTVFNDQIQAVRDRVAGMRRPRVLFVMGTDRPAASGPGTFIGDLIVAAGGVNAGGDIPGSTRWRRTHIDAIVAAAPDVLICQNFEKGASERARKYWLQWRDLPAAATGRVYVVNDPGWTIPSPRLADRASELAWMVHARPSGAGSPGMSLTLAWVYRLLAAAVAGAALAAAGAALQGLLRNPLAEPYVLGISSGAGVGVLVGLALAAALVMPEWVSTPVLAFAGAMMTCAVVYAIAQRRGVLDTYSLILAGVIVNAFNAAIMLTIYLYVDPHRIADFAHWAMGRLPDSVDVTLLTVCGACVVAGWVTLLMQGKAFNALGLGDEVAGSAGVSVGRLRIVTFLAVGVMTAAAVALAGPIGFVGLIVPHICRMVIGPDHRVGIVASGIAGALLLIGAETLCRTVGPWIGVSLIPVGILTALSGGPFFIYLLRKRFGEAPA